MCEDENDCSRHPGRGLIQLEILRILFEMPTHGYRIMDALRESTSNEYAPESGAIYTMLRRLERRGLVTSHWEKKTSRADRRVYNITQDGREFLKDGLQIVKRRRRLMDGLVQFYDDNFEDKATGKRRRSRTDERS